MQKSNTIAICGAGIAGVSTAYYLLQNCSDIKVLLIDKNQPLSFTTSKSGENFRDYWPQKCMRQFMSHSIHLMQELKERYGNNSFEMSYSGYNFISHVKENSVFGTNNEEVSKTQIEEITDLRSIQTEHPYLDKNVKKIVKVKNAGKIDVNAMGSLMLREARKKGLKQVEGEIYSINNNGTNFRIVLNSEEIINADKIIIAAGPFINNVANMLGLNFPISNTLQRKFIIPDPENIIPNNMPFTIYADSQYLDWSREEIDFFNSDDRYKWLLNEFPGGLHIKPEGEGIKIGWAFQNQNVMPQWETPGFEIFPQVVLKGASRFIPEIAKYENNIPTPLVEYAGYYTRTKENWPLIGPAKMQNVYVIGALAGYGTMGACAAGKLCSNYVLNITELPNYASNFHPLRYQNNDILIEMKNLISDGQL